MDILPLATLAGSSARPLQIQKSSSLISRNISVQGHRTSVRLEPEMWQALKDISRRENCSIHAICSLVAARKRMLSSLTAAIRVYVMLYYRAAATEEGHQRASHGNLHAVLTRCGVERANNNFDSGIAPNQRDDNE